MCLRRCVLLFFHYSSLWIAAYKTPDTIVILPKEKRAHPFGHALFYAIPCKYGFEAQSSKPRTPVLLLQGLQSSAARIAVLGLEDRARIPLPHGNDL